MAQRGTTFFKCRIEMDVQRSSIWEQPEPTCSMKGKSGDPEEKAAQIDVKDMT